jgi:hypothetical protein
LLKCIKNYKKLKYNAKLCVNLVRFVIYIKNTIEKYIMDLLSGYPNYKNIRIQIIIRICIRIQLQIKNHIHIRI